MAALSAAGQRVSLAWGVGAHTSLSNVMMTWEASLLLT